MLVFPIEYEPSKGDLCISGFSNISCTLAEDEPFKPVNIVTDALLLFVDDLLEIKKLKKISCRYHKCQLC